MRSGDLKESLYGMAARYARCVVAVSDSVAMQHHQRWPDLAVESIPNWIDLRESAPAEASHNFPSADKPLLIAVVARLAQGKGVEDVVAACRDEDGIELHIYGDGPMRDQLRNMGSQFAWLHFHGHVDHLSRRLPAHSILISGSYSEACSYSLIEGIQAGLLCVLTDIPAHREILGDDYPDALFFPPGDVAALRQGLQAARGFLSRDAGDSARMAVSMALERIATRNSPEAAKPRYLAVFSATDMEDGKV
jgi:glycosyltransferase involved in cell wall biosynthesis